MRCSPDEARNINSEDPVHVAAAGERLLALKPSLVFVEVEAERAVSRLISGEAVILVGWPGDALVAQGQNPAVRYILPEEDAFLWGDGFVISARSPRKETAELFLNFLLRPEISARIANEYYYATTNEAAFSLIDPDIRDNPVVFPPLADIQKAEWFLPHSPAGRALYDQVWQRFISDPSPEEE